STIRYASKGQKEFQCPTWKESWFPDAFIGTMAQLLIALETGAEPAIRGRDNLKTMALVEAAYLSAGQFRSVGFDEITRKIRPAGLTMPDLTAANFTPRARQVLELARKEAERFKHDLLGTGHLLLGMMDLGQGVGFSVLSK